MLRRWHFVDEIHTPLAIERGPVVEGLPHLSTDGAGDDSNDGDDAVPTTLILRTYPIVTRMKMFGDDSDDAADDDHHTYECNGHV